MTEYRTILERDLERITRPAGFTFDDLERRRGRKRRNQRIAAGVVGIAVFVAAVLIVTNGLSLDLSETPSVPAGSGTTGPAETGPAVAGPTVAPDTGWDGVGLPPKGTPPSTPAEGELVRGNGGIHPWRYAQVYEDGRVIWLTETTSGWLERRLTPHGVELVRSGALTPSAFLGPQNEVPESAWAEAEAKAYVPSRYVLCDEWSQETMRLLPQRTQSLLRSRTDEQAVVHGEVEYLAGGRGIACPEVTIEEARALDEVFLKAGFERSDSGFAGGPGEFEYVIPDGNSIGVIPLLPDGTFRECCPG
jgi:hypothetical protein